MKTKTHCPTESCFEDLTDFNKKIKPIVPVSIVCNGPASVTQKDCCAVIFLVAGIKYVAS